jgi:hypothetical protein
LCPKNHPPIPVLRLTLKSSHYIDYCCLRNRWRKLGPSESSKNPSFTADVDTSTLIGSSWQTNRWWKLSPWCPNNHPPNPFLPLTLKSSMYID